jgi:pyruvate dehydrogenase E2 component (dihydrolipoamide acetyltransferase)
LGSLAVPIEVNLAKLSPTMESGQMVKWLVKVGDKVKEGDTLAEIQTDKAVMPMEAFDEGIVARLDVDEGQEISLGQRVLVLAKKGEDPKAIADQFAKSAGSKTAAPATAPAPVPAEANAAANGPSTEHEITNSPVRPHESQPAPAANGQGGVRRVTRAPGERVRSTPLARKIAAAAGVSVAEIGGSGPSGRVIRADVEAYLKSTARQGAKPAPTTAAARADERIPHSPMRKTIAKRMLMSTQAIPAIHVSVDIRIDKLLVVRETLNQQLATEKIKLSVSDFVTKGVALALRKHPDVNASFEPDAIVRRGHVNLGIAVALEGGLIVPVLHDADNLGLREIRLGTEVLVDAARTNKLTGSQLTGGTFTISNLGMYGVREFDAIINQPEVAILAVGAGEKRPVVERDELVVGTVMTVTITADHRAVDGALAAEFLRTLKGLLEEPAAMLL